MPKKISPYCTFLLVVVTMIVVVCDWGYSANAASMDDYPSQWRDVPQDSVIDDWGMFNRECVSFVAWRLHSRNGFEMPFHDNANVWGTRAAGLGYTVNMTPAVGSVAWWTAPKGYHVAWVESVSADGNTVHIEEYNFDYNGNYNHRDIPKGNPSGYIHFKDMASEPTSTPRPDFNNDHRADLAWHQGTVLQMFAGMEGGHFNHLGGVGGIATPSWAGSGDVNGDGRVDVIYHQGSALNVFTWNDTYWWQFVNQTPGISAADAAVVGDFTGDKRADIAWHQGSILHLFAGLTNGQFKYMGGTGGIGTPVWAGAGNTNGGPRDEVVWYMNNTLTTFKWNDNNWEWVNNTYGINPANGVAVADFTGDERADLAWHQGNDLIMLAGLADGTFQYLGSTGGIGTATWHGAGNFDGKANADVLLYQGTTLNAFKWTGMNWALAGTTANIGAPTYAVTSG